VRRREWTGYLVRKCDYKTVNKVFLGKSDGKRTSRKAKIMVGRLR
jgi:hypothetical protein